MLPLGIQRGHAGSGDHTAPLLQNATMPLSGGYPLRPKRFALPHQAHDIIERSQQFMPYMQHFQFVGSRHRFQCLRSEK